MARRPVLVALFALALLASPAVAASAVASPAAGPTGAEGPGAPDGGSSADADPTERTAVLVVDDDGGEYTSIQAAVDAAAPGDVVRVMPGTYREAVALDADVTVEAPRGATLNGTGLADAAHAFDIDADAAPVVDGFAVTGYRSGVAAFSTTGDWAVRNTTFRDVGSGILAVYATGDWGVHDVTVRDSGTAIQAEQTTGDWTVADTVVRNVTEAHGLAVGSSSGDWTLRNVTVTDVDFVAVEASYSSGDWRILDATLADAMVGVAAIDASGNWTVRASTIRDVAVSDRYDFWQPPITEGVGIDAAGTNGSWRVRATRFVATDAAAIRAVDAAREGDATRNWFAGSVPERCTGAVDCGDRLAEWPPATPVASPTARTTPAVESPSPSTPGRAASPTRTTTPPGAAGETSTTAPLPVALVAAALVVAVLVRAHRTIGRR